MIQQFSRLPAKLAAAVLILPLLLTACGGGGGDGAAEPADPGQPPVNPDPGGGTDPTNPDTSSLRCPPAVARCASGT